MKKIEITVPQEVPGDELMVFIQNEVCKLLKPGWSMRMHPRSFDLHRDGMSFKGIPLPVPLVRLQDQERQGSVKFFLKMPNEVMQS